MTTFTDVLAYIGDQATEDEVHIIFTTANKRTKVLRERKAAANSVNLKIGDKVRLSGLSPKYMNGEVVTVTDKRGAKIVVVSDTSIGRISGGVPFTIPASCATLVE